MAVTFDASSSVGAAGVTVQTMGMTIGATAVTLVVTVAWLETNPSANGLYLAQVDVNGTVLTFNSQVINGYVLETWWIQNPPTGGVTITATWLDVVTNLPPASGSVDCTIGSMSFIGAANGLAANVVRASQGDGKVITLGRTSFEIEVATSIAGSSTNFFLGDAMIAQRIGNTPNMAAKVDGGQTQRWNVAGVDTLGNWTSGAGSSKAAANASCPMKWTFSLVGSAPKIAQSVFKIS